MNTGILIEDLMCTKVSNIDNLEGMIHFCNHIQFKQDIEVGGLCQWSASDNLNGSLLYHSCITVNAETMRMT